MTAPLASVPHGAGDGPDSGAPVWFITGASSGFGRVLARQILERGWRLVATARDATALRDLVSGPQEEERACLVNLDVARADQIETAVGAAIARFGRIDVLVNNAGYGYMSSAEEGVEAEIRAMFDANVFGLFAVTRAVLPAMRAQGRGHILNLSSIAGFIGLVGSGYYSATKHAVEGFSKALAQEIEPLGLHVTCVEPGPFRTDFAGRSLRRTLPAIGDYEDTVGQRLRATETINGNQPGDPERAAEAMIAIVEEARPPHHLVLGKAAYEGAIRILRAQLGEVEGGRQRSLAADYPDP